MKKLMTWLATAAILLSGLTGIALAEETTVGSTFFPDGKITTPEAPYVLYEDQYDDGTQKIGSTQMFFDIPADLLAFNEEYALLGEAAFNEKYNTPKRYDDHESLAVNIQIDTKFDDGPWLSESGNWDRFEYGENMNDANLNYRLSVGRYVDETSKLFKFEQSWLVYNEVDNENNAFLQPYLRSFKDGDGETRYQLDTENHTFSYRVRFVVYTENWDDLEDEAYWCMSDWSPVASIGKNGTQEKLEKPTKVDAPVLSDFKLVKNAENGVDAQYYVEFSKNTYDSIKYFSVVEDYFDPFVIESQIRVNGGEWVDTYTANGASLEGGYRSTDSNDVEITMDSQVEIRVRIVCNAMDGEASEWSNVVGNQAGSEVTPESSSAATTITGGVDQPAPEKHKCKVCGICPIQPLGICLFIWIAIILIVVIVLLLVTKKKDKDDQKEKKNKK